MDYKNKINIEHTIYYEIDILILLLGILFS